jgi:hypothetical protein
MRPWYRIWEADGGPIGAAPKARGWEEAKLASLSDCSTLPAGATHAQIIKNACTVATHSELYLTP